MNIYVFGDSIAQGYYDERGGWVARLWEPIVQTSDREDYYLYNVSVSGDTTEDVNQRFVEEAERRHISEYPSVVVLATGVNDAFYDGEEYRRSFDCFRESLEQLVEKASARAEMVVLLGSTHVDPGNNTVPDTEYSVRNEDLERIDAIKQDISRDNEDVDFLNIRESLESQGFSWREGIHPDTEGHRMIYEEVKHRLLPKLGE